MRLSKNFTLAEFTKSQTAERKGIDNTPSDNHIESMELLCNEVLEPIRYHFDKPIMIIEHDAVFIKKIDFEPEDTGYDIVGINNPLGCTRKSKVFHDKILEKNQFFQLAPYVDDDTKIPQGLAGNSAYIIKPEGAHDLVRLVSKHGLWPNDAIMCRQLIDIAVTRKFYTRVQGLESTTTL